MKRITIKSACLAICLTTSCANLSAAWLALSTGTSVPRPPRAPEEDAARFKFPLDLPESRTKISGNMAVAIQLAMDDFRPANLKPHKDASRMERCLYRRESYDVEATPGPEGIILVRFSVSHGACEEDGPAMDLGATYAIDVRGWRILAVQRP